MIPTVNLRADHKRYFTNPCELDAAAVAKFATDEWLEKWILELTLRLTARPARKDEIEDAGPYTGCGGVGFSLLKAAQAIPERLAQSVQACTEMLNNQFEYAKNGSRSRHSRYLCGTLGLYVIQAIKDHMSGRSVCHYKSLFSGFVETVCSKGYQRYGDDDILNGRAGFLLGAQMVYNETGVHMLTESEAKAVLRALLDSGREYSTEHNSPTPLFYEWHGKEYLGAAHGISGILQAFLTYWHFLDEKARFDVKATLDWFVGIQSPDGNFPSSSGYVGYPKGEDELVHWCHGAPGAIHLMITGITLFNDERYLQSAKRCADLIWHRGILKKGPGICHGVAGNGYALLLLSRVVNDPQLLLKAKAFAVIMMDPNFESLSSVPDSPFSLFEGWAGALCYLVDLRNPVRAQFPLVPTKLK
ncbi:unnamed protein product [Bursaphelenchus okinawaensis]|uniref:Uncharacterized protein n=1 Tax=Bursaphelenchus okinawaensis TaxID=465554 RepID=A0A811KW47_9BILA|nr:unnamed protein product [Bursaphelenchus okinawaensis]CAG9112331.1 unnamed protein product [Bursaphelenchus okinawaensis]